MLKKLLRYLDLNEEELDVELIRQRMKLEKGLDMRILEGCTNILLKPVLFCLPEKTSLLVRAKDFIIDEIREVTRKEVSVERRRMKECIIANTVFPRIGERMNDKDIANSVFDAEAVHKYRKKDK